MTWALGIGLWVVTGIATVSLLAALACYQEYRKHRDALLSAKDKSMQGILKSFDAFQILASERNRALSERSKSMNDMNECRELLRSMIAHAYRNVPKTFYTEAQVLCVDRDGKKLYFPIEGGVQEFGEVTETIGQPPDDWRAQTFNVLKHST
jgi:hypothetical protein